MTTILDFNLARLRPPPTILRDVDDIYAFVRDIRACIENKSGWSSAAVLAILNRLICAQTCAPDSWIKRNTLNGLQLFAIVEIFDRIEDAWLNNRIWIAPQEQYRLSRLMDAYRAQKAALEADMKDMR